MNETKERKKRKDHFNSLIPKKKWRKSIITWNNEERNTHIYTCGGGVELRIHVKIKIIKRKEAKPILCLVLFWVFLFKRFQQQ